MIEKKVRFVICECWKLETNEKMSERMWVFGKLMQNCWISRFLKNWVNSKESTTNWQQNWKILYSLNDKVNENHVKHSKEFNEVSRVATWKWIIYEIGSSSLNHYLLSYNLFWPIQIIICLINPNQLIFQTKVSNYNLRKPKNLPITFNPSHKMKQTKPSNKLLSLTGPA